MESRHWNSNITKIEPNEIRIRGYRVDELMGRVSFAEAVYLILRGELPSEPVGRMIDIILVSSLDHGTAPPSTLSAITAASTGAALNAALACGILSINKHHGGAIEGAMEMLLAGRKLAAEPEEAARLIAAETKAAGKRLPGFGHRLHTNDPRTARIFAAADELGLAGEYVKLMRCLEAEMAKGWKGGRTLPVNVDGAMAAALCELGFTPLLANLFFILARLPGLAAHVMEEMTRQKPMRVIDPVDTGYDGPAARSLEEEQP